MKIIESDSIRNLITYEEEFYVIHKCRINAPFPHTNITKYNWTRFLNSKSIEYFSLVCLFLIFLLQIKNKKFLDLELSLSDILIFRKK
jgi:hypothetical protein